MFLMLSFSLNLAATSTNSSASEWMATATARIPIRRHARTSSFPFIRSRGPQLSLSETPGGSYFSQEAATNALSCAFGNRQPKLLLLQILLLPAAVAVAAVISRSKRIWSSVFDSQSPISDVSVSRVCLWNRTKNSERNTRLFSRLRACETAK